MVAAWNRAVAVVTGNLTVRTVASICALLSLTIVLAVIGAVHVSTHDAHRAVEERAQLTVQILAGGASAALWNLDETAADAVLGSLSRDLDYVGSQILDETGRLFVRHGQAGDHGDGLIVARVELNKSVGDSDNRAIGILEVTLSTTRADAQSARRGWAIAGAGAILLVVVCGALAWLIRGVTRPILGMTRVIIDLADGRVEVPVPNVRFTDEVGRMAMALTTLKSHAIERLEFITRQARHMEDIERAVTERTRELSEALDTLRRAQDELLRSEKMAALGSMVAAIAHEINTPLGNSLTVASTLEEKVAEFSKMLAGTELRRSVLREFAEKFSAGNYLLIANLTRAADLIGSFKRVAVDQTSERRRTFDLATTATEIITMLRPTYKQTGHRIEIDIAAGMVMDSYPGAFSQVVTNLVANAVLHAFDGREGGVVRVAASPDADSVVTLTIADDGAGIAADVLPRIFDPFFTTKLGTGGSGLGLHIVYVTVTRILGGRISVDSQPGAGTTFTLRLPRNAPDHQAVTPA